MDAILQFLRQPWPWYVSGPIVGLSVPLLLLTGNKSLGISSSLREICAACFPGKVEFLNYDWRAQKWNLFFTAGLIAGGFIGGVLLTNHQPEKISPATISALQQLGIQQQAGMLPAEIFSWSHLFTLKSLLIIIGGGFLIGFETRLRYLGRYRQHCITNGIEW